MKIEREEKTVIVNGENSYHQITRSFETETFTTVTGTFKEMIDYSFDNPVYVSRNEFTDLLFPAWDRESKFCTVSNGTAAMFADTLADISGHGTYYHKFNVVAGW